MYIQRADDAETQARYARSPNERQTFLAIAALWRRLAEDHAARDESNARPPDESA